MAVAPSEELPGYHPGYADGYLAGRGTAATRETQAHADLGNFISHCKSQGLRGYKGEFVASDGTRIPCEFMFERAQPRGRDEDDR